MRREKTAHCAVKRARTPRVRAILASASLISWGIPSFVSAEKALANEWSPVGGVAVADWGTDDNWNSDQVPNATGAVAEFALTETVPANPGWVATVENPYTLGTIDFSYTSGIPVTISQNGPAGQLTLDNGAGSPASVFVSSELTTPNINFTVAVPVVVDSPLGATFTNNSTASLLVFNTTMTLTQGIKVQGPGNVVIDSAISGSGSIVKNGPATLTISQYNGNFSGPVSVNGGTLELTNPLALGFSSLNVTLNPGATLGLGFNGTFYRPISLPAGGVVTSTGNNTAMGGTVILPGSGISEIDGGSLSTDVLNITNILYGPGSTLNLNGNLSPSTIHLQGLVSNSTACLPTTIEACAGTIFSDPNCIIGPSTLVVINSSATYCIDSHIDNPAGIGLNSLGTLSGLGPVSGVLSPVTLTSTANSTACVTILGGTSPTDVFGLNNVTLTIPSTTLIIGGPGQGGIVNLGGTLLGGGNETWNVQCGATLSMNFSAAMAPGSSIVLHNNSTFATVGVTSPANVYVKNGGGVIDGSGALSGMTGQLIFCGNNTSIAFNGDGCLNHTLILPQFYQPSAVQNVSVILGPSQQGLWLASSSSFNANSTSSWQVQSGILDIPGGVNIGPGPVSLMNGRIKGGGSLGFLQVVPDPYNVTAHCVIAPGDPTGPLTLTNGYDASGANSSLVIAINGPNTGTDYGQLIVTGGNVTLGAETQTLRVFPGYTPTPGTDFWIIENDNGGATTGCFNGLPEGSLLWVAGNYFNIFYNANDLSDTTTGGDDVLLVSVQPEPGALGLSLLGLGFAFCRRRRRSRVT